MDRKFQTQFFLNSKYSILKASFYQIDLCFSNLNMKKRKNIYIVNQPSRKHPLKKCPETMFFLVDQFAIQIILGSQENADVIK